MTYGTWAWIAVAWLIGSFVFSIGIGLLFEDDDRYDDEYLSGDMTPEDIRRIRDDDKD